MGRDEWTEKPKTNIERFDSRSPETLPRFVTPPGVVVPTRSLSAGAPARRILHCGLSEAYGWSSRKRNDRIIGAACAVRLSVNKCDGRRPPLQLEGCAQLALSLPNGRPVFVGHDGAFPPQL